MSYWYRVSSMLTVTAERTLAPRASCDTSSSGAENSAGNLDWYDQLKTGAGNSGHVPTGLGSRSGFSRRNIGVIWYLGGYHHMIWERGSRVAPLPASLPLTRAPDMMSSEPLVEIAPANWYTDSLSFPRSNPYNWFTILGLPISWPHVI